MKSDLIFLRICLTEAKGTLITQMKQIETDEIRADPQNRRHPPAIPCNFAILFSRFKKLFLPFQQRNTMHFNLYRLINADAPQKYPYVATNPGVPEILFMAAEQMHLLDPSEILFFPEDYTATGQTIELDLERLNNALFAYTGQKVYRLLLQFTDERHCTITYHAPTNESAKDYDIFMGYPDPRAEQLIREIYPMFESIRDMVFG